MRKTLSLLAALVVSASSAAAHADTISGAFSAVGTDSFTANSITFNAPGTLPAMVAGDIEGTFAQYLSQGTQISFPDGTVLPYHVGTNTPPFPGGQVGIFAVTGTNTAGQTATFTFIMNQYTAGYTVNNTVATSGCNAGSTCLDVTGMGFFQETIGGAVVGNSGPGSFTISSQYQANQTSATTSFSASAGAVAGSAVTPEPSSLALLGTGLLGAVGVCRRKFAL